MDELKPCPFCGCGEAGTHWHHGYWSVTCGYLHGATPSNHCFQDWGEFDTEEKAVKAWNRRAECKDCFHFKVCAYVDHYLPVCDSFVADVAPVVRCKDCSHCSIEGSLYLCALWNHLTELDDFCSDAKRWEETA